MRLPSKFQPQALSCTTERRRPHTVARFAWPNLWPTEASLLLAGATQWSFQFARPQQPHITTPPARRSFAGWLARSPARPSATGSAQSRRAEWPGECEAAGPFGAHTTKCAAAADRSRVARRRFGQPMAEGKARRSASDERPSRAPSAHLRASMRWIWPSKPASGAPSEWDRLPLLGGPGQSAGAPSTRTISHALAGTPGAKGACERAPPLRARASGAGSWRQNGGASAAHTSSSLGAPAGGAHQHCSGAARCARCAAGPPAARKPT